MNLLKKLFLISIFELIMYVYIEVKYDLHPNIEKSGTFSYLIFIFLLIKKNRHVVLCLESPHKFFSTTFKKSGGITNEFTVDLNI